MKKSILLWAAGALLGISAATAALAPANSVTPQSAPMPQAVDAVAPSSITPANYTALLGKTEGISNVDLMFEGAANVVVNQSVTPIVAVGNYYGAVTRTSGATFTVTAIDGGVRISVVGSASYYGKDDNWFTYSAGTNGLNIALPEGLVTVTGADGINRPSQATVLRYTFANHRKVYPEGISDNADLMPEELGDLIFPANLGLGPNTSAAGLALLQAPEVWNDKWINVKNADNYSAYFKPYINDEDGRMHARWGGIDLATVAPGRYNIVLFGKSVITVDGEDEGGCWVYPINIVNAESADLTIVLADGSKPEGQTLPEFRFECAGSDFNCVIGASLNATIDGTEYPLNLLPDGRLTFSDDDAAAIADKYMNAPAFTVNFNIPAKSVKFKNGGVIYTNNAVNSQCNVRLFTAMNPSEISGDYYVKTLSATLLDGFNVDNANNEALMLDRIIPIVQLGEQDGQMAIAIQGLIFDQEVIPGKINSETREIIFDPIDFKVGDYDLQFTASSGVNTPVIATIDGNRGIHINNFALYEKNLGRMVLSNGIATFVPYVENVTPANTNDLQFTYDYSRDAVVATMTCPAYDADGNPLPNLTRAVIDLGDKKIVTTEVEPGKVIEVVVAEHPTPGSSFTATASFYLCKEQSALSEAVSFLYNPLAKDDIEADYFITSLKGEHIYFQGFDGSTFAVSSLPEGEFEQKAYNQKITYGDVVDGLCPVTIHNLLPSLTLYGTLDVVTHKIVFNRGDNREYPITVQNQLYDVPLYLVAGDGTAEKLTDATATLHDGFLCFDPCTFVIHSERTYYPVIRINECKSLVNKHIAPAAPVLSLSVESSENVHRVVGKVSVPTVDADGKTLHAESAGYCAVYVYRMGNEIAPLSIDKSRVEGLTHIHTAVALAPGDERTFYDEDVNVGDAYYYLAFAEHLDNVNYDDYAMNAILTTGVSSIVANPDALVTVFDLRGVCLMKDAPRAALSTLPTGIYIINGIKAAIAK